jgi:hypothetical protein
VPFLISVHLLACWLDGSDNLNGSGNAVFCACETRPVGNYRPSFFERYRDFLLSFNTLVTIANAILLLAGTTASWILDDDNSLLANILYWRIMWSGGAGRCSIRGVFIRWRTRSRPE